MCERDLSERNQPNIGTASVAQAFYNLSSAAHVVYIPLLTAPKIGF
jgi:hypothetical protein